MRSLATELRCAVLRVLTDANGYDNLNDTDFAFLGIVSRYAVARETGVLTSDDLATLRTYVRKFDPPVGATGPDMKRADPPSGPQGAPGNGVKGDVGNVGGPTGEVLPTVAPPNADDQAKLPLAPADRGPEPQDASSLLDTTAPEIDPSDPPPDYTQLNTAATRQLDT